MSDFRRFSFLLFVIVAVGAGAWGYYHLKQSKRPRLDAMSVIPDGCILYANTPDLSELNRKINSQSLIADKLKAFPEIDGFFKAIHLFDSILSGSEILREQMENNFLHLAVYGKTKLNWLLCFNISELGRQEEVRGLLSAVTKARNSSEDIYEFTQAGLSSCYLQVFSGVITFSDSKELLERCHGNDERLVNRKSFGEFKSVLFESSLLSLYVDHELYKGSIANSRLQLSKLPGLGFSAGAISVEPSELKLNGYLNTYSLSYLSALENETPLESEILAESLPAGVSSFTAFGFGNFSSLRQRLDSTEDLYWKDVNIRALFNLQQEFYNNSANLLCSFRRGEDRFLLVNIADSAKAKEHLGLLNDSTSRRPENKLNLFSPLTDLSCKYSALYKDHLIFSESAEALEGVMKDLKSGHSLESDENFMNYSRQNFPEKFNYLVYAAPGGDASAGKFFNFHSKNDREAIANFRHFSFSLVNDAQNFRYRLHLIHQTELKGKDAPGNSLWTLKTDTNVISGPSLFVNHLSGENELLFTDANKNLCLADAKGKILWKKKLEEEVISEIHRIDALKNGKFQLLFNTRNYLHLIDRKGNYVSGYPVKLPGQATSALSVYDYEGNREYRIFIGCSGNIIYNYAISGQKVEGFVPVKTEQAVELAPDFLRVAGSDMLATVDREGRIYVFSRRGAERQSLRNRAIAGCRSFYIDAGNSLNSTWLIYFDEKNGLLNKISFSDRKEIVKMQHEIGRASVLFALVDENRHMDVIITSNKTVTGYDLNGNQLFEKTAPATLFSSGYYGDESHSLAYAFSKESGELFVFDLVKQTTKNFKATGLPLVCNLFRDKKAYMVYPNGSEVNCVLLD